MIEQLNTLDCSKNQSIGKRKKLNEIFEILFFIEEIEPVEFERLIVSDDEDDPNDEFDGDDDNQE